MKHIYSMEVFYFGICVKLKFYQLPVLEQTQIKTGHVTLLRT